MQGGETMAKTSPPADGGPEIQKESVPDFVVDSLARCLLPKIQDYFASPEGQAAFEEWKRQQNT